MAKIPPMGLLERRHLIELGRKTGDPATALRFLAVARLGLGHSTVRVAESLHLARSTVVTAAQRYLAHGVDGLHHRRCNNGAAKVDLSFMCRVAELLLETPEESGWSRPSWTRELLCLQMGPELISKALDLWSGQHGVKLDFIQPGKPMQNGHVESFNGRFREECISQTHFPTFARARVEIELWRVHYNCERPRGALDARKPKEFGDIARRKIPPPASRAGAIAEGAQQRPAYDRAREGLATEFEVEEVGIDGQELGVGATSAQRSPAATWPPGIGSGTASARSGWRDKASRNHRSQANEGASSISQAWSTYGWTGRVGSRGSLALTTGIS